MKHWIWIVMVLSLITEPIKCKPLVAVGGQLPRWGVIGRNVQSYGSPRNDTIEVRNLRAGTVVRLHEISRPVGDWVMISPAEWIPLKDVCGR